MRIILPYFAVVILKLRIMRGLFKTVSCLALAMLAGCSEDSGWHSPDVDPAGSRIPHEMIVLGKKLDDPYSVKNVTKALESLYPTKADRVDVTPTDVYVRFLPKTEAEYQKLVDAGYDLMDHPLDYQILQDGDYYHDPALDEEDITWQYAVIPHGEAFPEGVEYEVLDDCYIPESGTRSEDGIDWEAVERESFRLTGNEMCLAPVTRGSAEKPSGRVTVIDDEANGGQPFGVSGVTVVCNVFVKFATAYTDRDGYYKMDRKFSAKPRYRLMFKNKEGFAIGFNKVIAPASMSALGQGAPSGMDVTVTKDSDVKLWRRTVVNNAAYDYIARCGEGDMNITRPPKNLRIWIFKNATASSAVMMRQGAVIDNALVRSFLGDYAGLLKSFLPDITLGLKDQMSYSSIYSETCHELAHASHFAQAGKSFWDKYIKFILTSFVSTGGVTYGTGAESDAGYCEVGEMWGYYMQNAMYHDRYGGTMPVVGMSYWFHPQIFRYLEERGMTRSQIFSVLKKDVDDRETLKMKLLESFPGKAAVIQQVFDRYAK